MPVRYSSSHALETGKRAEETFESEVWEFLSFVSSDKGPGRGRSGFSHSSQLAPLRCLGGSRGGTACLFNGAGEPAGLSCRKPVRLREGASLPLILTLAAGPFRVSWGLERSSGCEQGCVTDLVFGWVQGARWEVLPSPPG